MSGHALDTGECCQRFFERRAVPSDTSFFAPEKFRGTMKMCCFPKKRLVSKALYQQNANY